MYWRGEYIGWDECSGRIKSKQELGGWRSRRAYLRGRLRGLGWVGGKCKERVGWVEVAMREGAGEE